MQAAVLLPKTSLLALIMLLEFFDVMTSVIFISWGTKFADTQR